MTLQPYTSLPLDQGEVSYAYGPDSFPRPGVEPGRIDPKPQPLTSAASASAMSSSKVPSILRS